MCAAPHTESEIVHSHLDTDEIMSWLEATIWWHCSRLQQLLNLTFVILTVRSHQDILMFLLLTPHRSW